MDLSPETAALARRLADARRLPVDTVVRDALAAVEERSLIDPDGKRDVSPEAIAARKASIREIVAELASMPVLDPRPVQQIVDDINAV